MGIRFSIYVVLVFLGTVVCAWAESPSIQAEVDACLKIYLDQEFSGKFSKESASAVCRNEKMRRQTLAPPPAGIELKNPSRWYRNCLSVQLSLGFTPDNTISECQYPKRVDASNRTYFSSCVQAMGDFTKNDKTEKDGLQAAGNYCVDSKLRGASHKTGFRGCMTVYTQYKMTAVASASYCKEAEGLDIAAEESASLQDKLSQCMKVYTEDAGMKSSLAASYCNDARRRELVGNAEFVECLKTQKSESTCWFLFVKAEMPAPPDPNTGVDVGVGIDVVKTVSSPTPTVFSGKRGPTSGEKPVR